MADRAEPEDLQGRAANATAAADPARVFISYASADKSIADAVCAALEPAGIPCWIAPRDVKPGALYADAIVRAITNAKALVLVLSKSSIASSHVGKEVERASSKKRPIIALRTDAAPLTPALEYFLSESQWIDASATNRGSACARLIDGIRDSQSVGPGATPPLGPAAGTPTSRQDLKLFTMGLAVAALAVTAVVSIRFVTSKHIAAETPTSTASTAMSDKSIAVLPFADMSEKKDQEYFADGMAEEILDLLAKIPGLTVIGRTSSFQFKGKNEDLRTIGAKLNVAYVLEGSVRNAGDQVRVTTQLINTRSGAHEWSETYDRHVGDVLKLQDAISAAVVRELQLTVAPGYMDSRSTIKSAKAYDLLLRGRHAADHVNREGLGEAATLFQQALDLNPTSADAAAALAQAYVLQVEVGSLAQDVGFERARLAATDALRWDPKNVLAHVVMARVHFQYDWDWAAAERELQKAKALAPGNVDVLYGAATLSETLGREDDALQQIKSVLAQDPINPSALVELSNIQLARGHVPEAEAAARRVLEIRPTYAYEHFNLGVVLLERGDRDGAFLEMQKETIDEGKQQGLALVYYALGRKAEADAALRGMLKDQANGNALGIAEVYAFRGQSDEAMQWLERAYVQKDPYLAYNIKTDTLLKNLAGDPRSKDFLRKMNLPE
jgi:TolB-like protein